MSFGEENDVQTAVAPVLTSASPLAGEFNPGDVRGFSIKASPWTVVRGLDTSETAWHDWVRRARPIALTADLTTAERDGWPSSAMRIVSFGPSKSCGFLREAQRSRFGDSPLRGPSGPWLSAAGPCRFRLVSSLQRLTPLRLPVLCEASLPCASEDVEPIAEVIYVTQ